MGKNEIGKYIQIVSRQLKRNMDETLSKYNVTGVQSMLIGYIYKKSKQGEVFAKDIEEEFKQGGGLAECWQSPLSSSNGTKSYKWFGTAYPITKGIDR